MPARWAYRDYLDRFTFGVTAEFDAVPDVDVLTEGITQGVAELKERSSGSTVGGRLLN